MRNYLLAFVLILIIANSIYQPLGDDQRIFLAFAQQADDFYGPFPGNLIECWTIRGIGFKALYYGLYKTALLMVSYDDKLAFEAVCKAIWTVLSLGLLGLGAYAGQRFMRTFNLDPALAFFIAAVSAYSVSFDLALQAENVAVVMVLAALGMSLGDRVWNVLAGILMALLFTLKGITLAMGLYPLIFLWLMKCLYHDWLHCRMQLRENLWRTGTAWITSSVILLACLAWFAPRDLIDLYDASLFQSSLSGVGLWERLQRMWLFPVNNVFHMPFLFTGAAMALFVFVYFADRRPECLAAYSLLWMLPAAIVLAQGRFYSYHYEAFQPAVVITWGMALAGIDQVTTRRCWRPIILTLPVILMAACTSPLAVFPVTRSTEFARESRETAEQYRIVDEELKISREPEVLYLTDGRATYYFKARSASRYYYPLPVKRSIHNPALLTTSLYRDEMRHIRDYQGKWIVVMDQWFELWNFPEIQQKLEDEYPTRIEARLGRYEFSFYLRQGAAI